MSTNDDHHQHDAHNHEMHTNSDNNGTLTNGGDHENHSSNDYMVTKMSPYLFTRTTNFSLLFKKSNIQLNDGFILALIGSLLFAFLAALLSLVMHHNSVVVVV